MNLFPVRDSNLIVQLFNTVLGQGWESFHAFTPSPTGSLLTQMMFTFAGFLMSGIILRIFYVSFVSVGNRAHKGPNLSERYDTMWTPIKTGTSFLLVSPASGTGLSVVCMFVLFCAGQGIGLADQLWERELDYFAERGGQLSAVEHKIEKPRMVEGILRSIVLTEIYDQNYFRGQDAAGVRSFEWYGPDDSRTQVEGMGEWRGFPYIKKTAGISAYEIGYISVPCEKKNSRFCQTKKDATGRMMVRLQDVARAIVSHHKNETKLTDLSPMIRDAYEVYQKEINNALDQWREKRKKAMISGKSGPSFQKLKRQGWPAAGMYYQEIARQNKAFLNGMSHFPKYQKMDSEMFLDRLETDFVKPMKTTKDVTRDALYFPEKEGKGGSDQDMAYGWIASKLPPVQGFFSGPNPIIEAQAYAEWFLTIFKSLFALNMAVDGGGYLGKLALMAGSTTGMGHVGFAVSVAGIALVEALGYILDLIMWFFFAIGMYGKYVLPAIPYAIIFFAVVRYVIKVIVGTFAAPLWALSLAFSTGNEFVSGRRFQAGLIKLLEILFEPALIVIGFWVAHSLTGAFSTLLNAFFTPMTASIAGGEGQAGLLGYGAFIVLYYFLLTGLISMLYGVIALFPTMAFSWIGGAQGGEEPSPAGSMLPAMGGLALAGGSGSTGAKEARSEAERELRQSSGYEPSGAGSGEDDDGGITGLGSQGTRPTSADNPTSLSAGQGSAGALGSGGGPNLPAGDSIPSGPDTSGPSEGPTDGPIESDSGNA